MMAAVFSIGIGYLLGMLHPAALFAAIKKQNLRKSGTGNLGATNTMLVLGKGYGAAVMLFDIAKAYIAVKLVEYLFPALASAGALAGTGAIIGHVFPFYLKFKGGKGLASFGGMILALDPLLFLILLILTMVLMLIVNYGVIMPISAAVLFPVLYGIRSGDLPQTLICAVASVLIVWKHFGNIARAKGGNDIKVREYIKTQLFHK